MTTEKASRKDKNQNIQVFVRLRPLNQRERDIKSIGVVEVINNREVVVRQSQQTSLTKKFTFDRAFGPNAKQVEVYQDVVSPLIEEVLAGYNCTVFAYGQTGTGKTHTMVGEHVGDETTWQNDPLAGIIPRALSQLFDELRISNTEYTVRVSYLELYNEELFDLLSSSEDNSKLRIYEDVTRKGSNIVNGLEEITVYNKNEVYKIMAQGQERKRVASTLMNAQSSRSHTVFTIVVHMKENSPEGEELVKIGKLNLVDLAGSENISKAGSDNPAKRERARECVNINQSLLTLGRVITALVERHPHIPYRESKLTRILQESLGGRTKTSIIATISPGHKDLEETMSTLEYAHRAKNIQNKPEVNQKMTKKAILKEYAEEIDKLKRDLQAARDKNGVYLASETFTEMTLKQEEQRKEIQELLLKKRAMEDERDRMEAVFRDLNHRLEVTGHELDSTRSQLNSTQAKLADTSSVLRTTRMYYEEQKYLVGAQQQTEKQLTNQAQTLLRMADTAAAHAQALHESLDKRRSIEMCNLEVTRMYRNESSQQREFISSGLQQFTNSLLQTLNGLHSALDNFTTTSTDTQEQNKQKLGELVQKIMEALNEMKSLTSSTHSCLSESVSNHRCQLSNAVSAHSELVQRTLSAFVQAVGSCVSRAHCVLNGGQVGKFVDQWYTGAAARVSSLRRAHGTFVSVAAQTEDQRTITARRHRDARRMHIEARGHRIQANITEIEEEKAQIEERLSRQLADIEAERMQTEQRLEDWVQEERRLLEERLARHVASEKMVLEERLSKKIAEVEEERRLLEERISRHVQWQRAQLEDNQRELEVAEKDLEEYDRGREELEKNVTKYTKEFDEGTQAVSIDMEVLSSNVVQVVDHLHGELVAMLRDARELIENESQRLVETDKATAKQFNEDTEAMFDNIVRDTKQALDCVIEKVESNNSFTIRELTTLAASITSLITSAASHLSSQSETLEAVQHQAMNVASNVRQALQRHEELEGRYLAQEYRLYSPTGNTPVRTEYRYPRVLAATSPADRVLARYRAMRQNSNDDECVVIESDPETRGPSDSETSSLSEDSAVAFVAPSPPSRPSPPDTHAGSIVKSTSETDIYVRRKQEQGKENADRSIQYKKPSKLPAPSSHKKPLIERN